MQRLAVETTVFADPEAVYERLAAVEEYPRYAEYLVSVERGEAAGAGGRGSGAPAPGERADGGDGGDAPPEYALRFAWWRLSYTVHSAVTATEPPDRIEWCLTRDLDARGAWTVTPVSTPADAPEGTDAASRLRFAVRYDPDSFQPSGLALPPLVSLDWLAERVTPLVVEEARRVVGRFVADLEGTGREPSLSVERGAGVRV